MRPPWRTTLLGPNGIPGGTKEAGCFLLLEEPGWRRLEGDSRAGLVRGAEPTWVCSRGDSLHSGPALAAGVGTEGLWPFPLTFSQIPGDSDMKLAQIHLGAAFWAHPQVSKTSRGARV